MQEKIIRFTTFFLTLSLFCVNVFVVDVSAIDCEYEDAGLTITYDENSSNVTFKSDFADGNYRGNLLVLSWGEGFYATDEIYVDQTLYKKYQGYSCPTNIYVCEYSEWSLDLPSLMTLGYDLGGIITSIPMILGFDTSEVAGDLWEQGWSLLKINEKKLYIYTEEEYDDSEVKKYEGGLISDDLDQSALEGWAACGGNNDGWGWKLAGGVCWLGWGLIDGLVLETIIGDGTSLLYYKQSSCTNIQYTGEYNKFDVNCSFMTSTLYEYQDLVEEYKSCNSDLCKRNVISDMQQVETNLNSRCDNVLQNYEYSESQKDCIKQCLNLDVTLNDLKKGTDLYSYRVYDDNPNSCNFSSRLVAWIMKVLEWIRYIVPVLLIILSIMEFIKAVSSDEEDAIRKAGSRFVKRLIVAALIFVLPLILEFLLGIFNIPVKDYCLK